MPHLPVFSRLHVLSVCFVLALNSHAAAQSTDQDSTDARPEAVASSPGSETVVARVGNVVITLGEVVAFRQTLPDQFQQLPDEVLTESILTQMIDQTLLEQAARESGLDQRSAYQLALRNQRRAVMADAFMSSEIFSLITEKKIAEAYDAQFTSAPAVPEVRSSHILVENRDLADDLKEQLDEGADFARLASKYSTDPTAARGGDRGWLSYDRMVPDYADAVRGMVVGELAGPVETPFGWHLIRVDGKRDRPVPPLEVVQGALINQLSKQIEAETLGRLREAVTIERMTTDLPAGAVRADYLIQD